jgi:hypothetical protein
MEIDQDVELVDQCCPYDHLLSEGAIKNARLFMSSRASFG